MEKIIPFLNKQEALKSLDNGGRFYNFLSSAQDGKITTAEMAKAAGVFSNEQKMWLFFEMATKNLNREDKALIIEQFSDKLKESYNEENPKWLKENSIDGNTAKSVIVFGVPAKVEEKSDLQSFIMVPIITAGTMTFTLIPIFDNYEVYEIDLGSQGDKFLLAHNKTSQPLPAQEIYCGGVLKEMKKGKGEEAVTEQFLEIMYFMD